MTVKSQNSDIWNDSGKKTEQPPCLEKENLPIETVEITYVSLHYKTCPIEFREKWSQLHSTELIQKSLKSTLQQKRSTPIEVVVISTCNRFDVCFSDTHSLHETLQFLKELYRQFYQNDVLSFAESQLLENCVRFYQNEDALKALIRTASSLDSLVIGESQIFGQIKESFEKAVKDGICLQKLSRIFHFTFQTAKRIRHETEIGKYSLSISTAAIDIVKKIFGDLHNKKIMILGAGQMAKITLQNLKAQNLHDKNITMANRTLDKLFHFKEKQNELNLTSLSLVIPSLHNYDACFVALGGDEILLREEELVKIDTKRAGKTMVIMDISIPRKVDFSEKVYNKLENLFLYHVDDLAKITDEHLKNRMLAIEQAEVIMSEAITQFISKLNRRMQEMKPVALFHQWVHTVIAKEVEKFFERDSLRKGIDPKIIATASAKKIVAPLVKDILSRDFLSTASFEDFVYSFAENLETEIVQIENLENSTNEIPFHSVNLKEITNKSIENLISLKEADSNLK